MTWKVFEAMCMHEFVDMVWVRDEGGAGWGRRGGGAHRGGSSGGGGRSRAWQKRPATSFSVF
jgi:hypothetical protein